MFFSVPFIFFGLFVLLPPSGSSYPGLLHRRGASPRFSLRYVLLLFDREDSALSSLVDSRQIVPTRAVVGALGDSWYHFFEKYNSVRRFETMTPALGVFEANQ